MYIYYLGVSALQGMQPCRPGKLSEWSTPHGKYQPSVLQLIWCPTALVMLPSSFWGLTVDLCAFAPQANPTNFIVPSYSLNGSENMLRLPVYSAVGYGQTSIHQWKNMAFPHIPHWPSYGISLYTVTLGRKEGISKEGKVCNIFTYLYVLQCTYSIPI